MHSSLSAPSAAPQHQTVDRPARSVLGVAVVAFLILLAVIGGSAEHGSGVAELRRGPASVVLSVLFTLAMLAGIASLALLFWGLVTRNRRSLDGSEPRRHSPVLVAGAALAVFACLAALLALAAHSRRPQSFATLGGRPASHTGPVPHPLPFNTVASFTTSAIVVAAILAVVVLRLVRTMGWHRLLHRAGLLRPDSAETVSGHGGTQPREPSPLGRELAFVAVADPGTEPDPRRAVIRCYLQMLEVAARTGPERRSNQTPSEYLLSMLAATARGTVAATSLTGLFERARYSQQPVGESMRSDAITALAALRRDLLTGAVG